MIKLGVNDPCRMAGNIEASKRKAARWALIFRWLLSTPVVLSVLGCTAMLLMARQFGPMFDDMLAETEALPSLTKMLIHGWMPLVEVIQRNSGK